LVKCLDGRNMEIEDLEDKVNNSGKKQTKKQSEIKKLKARNAKLEAQISVSG